jgi:hypothetical protein
MGRDFPGWDAVGSDIIKSAQHPYPQEFLGIERQRVRPDDLIERRRRYLLSWTARKGERTRQWSKWRELADHFMPELGRFLVSDHNMPKDTSKILNNTTTRAMRALAAGLLAGHTSPARPWVNFTVADPDLAEWRPMQIALYELNRRVRLVFELSNFYRAMAMGVYPGLAVFGMGACMAEEDPRRVMRFVPLAMGTYCIAGDGQGEIDSMQYEEAWTVAELVKEFGWGNVSNSVKVAWNGGWYEQYVSVLRTIEPNEQFIPGAIGRLGGKWGSAWMEIGGLASAAGALSQPSSDPTIGFLRDSKYETFPALVARWATTSRDVYPTGPGHDGLPDARMLMQLERRKLLAISKGINPAMLIPDVLRLNRLSMLPGDAIYYPTGTQGAEIKPAHVVDPRFVQETREEAQMAMQRIGQAAFADLMLLFADDRPGQGKQPITAQEVAAQQQEKMLQLGPVLENINEFLTKLCERTIAIMAKRRLLPEFPREARGMRLKVEFVSILSQAQKLLGVQAKERWVQFVGQVAQIKGPEMADNVSGDKLIRRYADDVGVPPDVLEDPEVVQATRAERQRQIEIQKAAQSMMSAADAAKNLSGVPMDGDNLVTRMLGQPAGVQAGEQGGGA